MARSHSIYLLVDKSNPSVQDIWACFTVKHEAISYAIRHIGPDWDRSYDLVQTGDGTEFTYRIAKY